MKIGTVDLQKLFTEYPGTKKAQEKFNTLAKKKQGDLVDLKTEVTDLDKELRTNQSLYTKKQIQEKQYVIQKKAEDYQRKENEVLSELKVKEGEMTQDIFAEIKKVVSTVAKNKGVDLVLDQKKAIYLRDGIDLSDAVLKEYKNIVTESSDETEPKKDELKKEEEKKK